MPKKIEVQNNYTLRPNNSFLKVVAISGLPLGNGKGKGEAKARDKLCANQCGPTT
jgi:hypothetical protein